MNTKQFSELSTAEKIKLLNKEFDRIDVNHDSKLSFQELCKALDEMNEGREFDRNVARQLYEEMDKNHDRSVSRQEFIDVYLKGEAVLKEKIHQCELVITDCERQRKDIEMKLKEASRKEKLNQHMIKEGSVCAVTIVEITELKMQPGAEIFVRILCGDQVYEGAHFKYDRKGTVDQTLNIAITTGQEVLKIVVMGVMGGKTAELGEANLPVNQLIDQAVHGGNVDLQEPTGKPTNGKINLSLQWIHSSVKYLSEVLKKWDEHIQQTNTDLQDYQADLKALYEPFRMLKGLNEIKTKEPKRISPIPVESPFLKWQRHGFFATVIMLTFAFLACFVRNTFLDIIVGLAFMFSWNKHFQETQGFTALTLTVAFSILYDILWLSIYSSGWTEEPVAGEAFSRNDKVFGLIMSYFLFLAKCVVFYVYSVVDKHFKLISGLPKQSNLLEVKGLNYLNTAPNTNERPFLTTPTTKIPSSLGGEFMYY